MELMKDEFESNLDTLRGFVLDIPENNVTLRQLHNEYMNVWTEQWLCLKSLLSEGDDTVSGDTTSEKYDGAEN